MIIKALYEKITKTFLFADERGRLFMNIYDKIETAEILQDNKRRHCPPHRWPHSLPVIQPPICDEPCHIHQTDWRQYSHHNPFCKILKCPNYEDMVRAREKYFSERK